MPATAVIGSVAVGAIGANSQAKAASKASNTQANASIRAAEIQAQSAREALALQEKIYNDQRGIYAPTATLGAGALARQYIMAGGDPSQAQSFYGNQTKALNGTAGTDPGLDGYTSQSWMSSDPGYAFRMGEGTKALERSAAARGQLFSGATGQALTRYGQDYASNEFMNAFNRLGAISGSGQTATQNIGTSGSNYASGASNTIQNAGNATAQGALGAANARASGYMNQANAWGGFADTLGGAIGYGVGQGWFGKGAWG